MIIRGANPGWHKTPLAGQAYAWSRTKMGDWAFAQSPILVTTITLKRLVQSGYESLLDYYERISPQLNEPLYTRPVRTVV
jgi:RNA-directed DNA polymerase